MSSARWTARVRGVLDAVRSRYGAKLALAFVGVIVLVAGFGAAAHVQTADQLREDVRSDLSAVSETRADEFDTWLRSVERGARLTSSHPALATRDTDRIRTHLASLVERDAVPEGVIALHYLDTQEMRIVTSSAPKMIGVSPREQGAAFAADPPSFSGPDDVHVSEPFSVPVVDFPVVAVISPVPGQPDRAVIYMINLERRVSTLTGDEGEQYTTVVNEDGRYVAHPDRGKILTPYEPDGSGAFEAALAGKVGYSTAGEEVSAYVGLEATDWVVVTHVPKAQAYAIGHQVTSQIVGLVLLALVSLALIGVTVGSNTVISLRQLARKADRMAGGDLDVEFHGRRRDEFGTLVDSFSDMRDSLAETIEAAESAREAAESQRAEAEARTRHLEEKAGHYEDVMIACADGDLTRRVEPDGESEAMRSIGVAFNEMVEDLESTVADVEAFAHHVSAATDAVDAGADEVLSASEDVETAVDEIADGAHRQTAQLETAAEEMDDLSASAEEVAATVDSVAETTGEAAREGEAGRAAAERAIDEMDAVEAETDRTVEAIERLDTEMAAIGEVVNVITQIAEQTNLLALNASIEAAHSGQGGEGFAVVADEVKSLAEETKDAAADIEGRIERIEERTGETVADMRATSERIREGVSTVEEAVESLERIAHLVDEIDGSVKDINDATGDQAEVSQAVLDTVDDVAGISAETGEAADEVAAAAAEQTATLSTVGGNVADLAERAESLVAALDDFDVEGADAAAADAGGVGVAGDD